MPILAALVRRSETPLGPKKRRRERWIAVAGIVDADRRPIRRDVACGPERKRVRSSTRMPSNIELPNQSALAKPGMHLQFIIRSTALPLYVKDALRAITKPRGEARQPGDSAVMP